RAGSANPLIGSRGPFSPKIDPHLSQKNARPVQEHRAARKPHDSKNHRGTTPCNFQKSSRSFMPSSTKIVNVKNCKFEYRLPWNKRRRHPPKTVRSYKRRTDRYRGPCACGEHVWSVLTQGYVTLVSPEDARHLRNANWFADVAPRSVYAAVNRSYTIHYLHRAILDKPNSDIDHKDHNGLNNKRENLRLCLPNQNSSTKRQRKDKSNFRGVSHTGNERWRASITCNRKTRYLGTFD